MKVTTVLDVLRPGERVWREGRQPGVIATVNAQAAARQAPRSGCYCSGHGAAPLKLLGGFLLRADDRPRALPARKAQALLASSRCGPTRARARRSRTPLADVGERQARQSLRQTMVRLRRVLAADPRALLAQGDTVTLTPAALDLDVSAFERLVRRGTPEALESAVALYQGPLLDGVHVAAPGFEEWLEVERARLGELAVDALRRLVERHGKAGRVEPAAHAAARLLAIDPSRKRSIAR